MQDSGSCCRRNSLRVPWPGQLVGDHRLWECSPRGCDVRDGCCHLLPLVTPCMQGSCGAVEGILGVTGPAVNRHSDARSVCHQGTAAGLARGASDTRAPVTPCQAEKATAWTEHLEKQLLPTSVGTGSSKTRGRMRPSRSRNSCRGEPACAQPVLGQGCSCTEPTSAWAGTRSEKLKEGL